MWSWIGRKPSGRKTVRCFSGGCETRLLTRIRDKACRNAEGTRQRVERPGVSRTRPPQQGWASWEDWFQAVGYPEPQTRFTSFDNYVYSLEAAVAGQGIALGWRIFVDQHLETGALVRARRWLYRTLTTIFAACSPNRGACDPSQASASRSCGDMYRPQRNRGSGAGDRTIGAVSRDPLITFCDLIPPPRRPPLRGCRPDGAAQTMTAVRIPG